MSVGVNVSPRSLIARTRQGLEKKMKLNNLERGTFIQYFSIQENYKTGVWTAWFNTENKTDLRKTENKDGLS